MKTPPKHEQRDIYELLKIKMVAMRKCMFATVKEVDQLTDSYYEKYNQPLFNLLSFGQKWRMSWFIYYGARRAGLTTQTPLEWFIDNLEHRIREALR